MKPDSRTLWRHCRVFGRLAGTVMTLLALSVLYGDVWAFPVTSFLDPAGPVAAAQKNHFIWVTLITLIVVLPAIILTPYLAWRYRYGSKNVEYSPKWAFSWLLEILIWGIPAIIVVILSVQLWHSTHQLDPYQPISSPQKPLRIEVVGLDWKWLFIYPDEGIATVGEMAVPIGRPIALDLTTDTVMQSFWIPALGGQIYAMPGMRTKLHLLADKLGQFRGLNSQFNGMGFEHQQFLTLSLKVDDFQHWVDQVKTRGIPLNSRSYGTLNQQSTRAESFAALGTSTMPPDTLYFSSIPPHFFRQVIARYLSRQPLTPVDQPGTKAHGGHSAPSPNGKTGLGT
ncbi:MAG: hypothetical protein PF483_04185 [Halothiobacillus sp.]|jgi:cytochrome o ubiquinol oxidase subunit 2|nr:hypothetical protein [Halothiobacillus sp.]